VFTVILIDTHVEELLDNHKFLFQPFIKSGELCFCQLDPSEQTLTEACPSIYDCIRTHREWQVMIINAESIYNYKSGYIPDRDNPFDFSALDRNNTIHSSDIPMVRLAHMFAGYPDLPKEYVKAKKYQDPKSYKQITVPTDAFTKQLESDLLDQDVIISDCIIEKPPSAEIVELHRQLCLKYDFSGDRPQKVLFVGTRSRSDERSMSMTSLELRTLETRQNEWGYNRYPNACRFFVADIPRAQSAAFEQALLEFWISVLTLAVNELPSDVVKPDYLYNLSVDISQTKLENTLHKHLDQLESAEKYLRDCLAETPENTYKSSFDFISVQPIGVRSRENLEIDHQNRDILENSSEAVDQISMENVNKAYKSIVNDTSNQRRVIDNGAVQLKREIAMSAAGLPEQQLDQYQFDYLQNKIDSLELDVLGARPTNDFDEELHIQRVDEVRHAIDNNNADEASTESVLHAGGVAVGLALLGFLPYLVESFKKGTVLYALVLIAGILGVTYLGGRVALSYYKTLKTKQNQKILDKLDPEKKFAEETRQTYESYFTNINTLMHCRAIKASAAVVSDQNMVRRRLLNAQILAVKEVKKRELNYIADYNFKSYKPKLLNSIESSYDYTIEPADNNPFFYLVPNPNDADHQLEEPGLRGFAPYSFVRLLVIDEEEKLRC